MPEAHFLGNPKNCRIFLQSSTSLRRAKRLFIFAAIGGMCIAGAFGHASQPPTHEKITKKLLTREQIVPAQRIVFPKETEQDTLPSLVSIATDVFIDAGYTPLVDNSGRGWFTMDPTPRQPSNVVVEYQEAVGSHGDVLIILCTTESHVDGDKIDTCQGILDRTRVEIDKRELDLQFNPSSGQLRARVVVTRSAVERRPGVIVSRAEWAARRAVTEIRSLQQMMR